MSGIHLNPSHWLGSTTITPEAAATAVIFTTVALVAGIYFARRCRAAGNEPVRMPNDISVLSSPGPNRDDEATSSPSSSGAPSISTSNPFGNLTLSERAARGDVLADPRNNNVRYELDQSDKTRQWLNARDRGDRKLIEFKFGKRSVTIGYFTYYKGPDNRVSDKDNLGIYILSEGASLPRSDYLEIRFVKEQPTLNDNDKKLIAEALNNFYLKNGKSIPHKFPEVDIATSEKNEEAIHCQLAKFEAGNNPYILLIQLKKKTAINWEGDINPKVMQFRKWFGIDRNCFNS